MDYQKDEQVIYFKDMIFIALYQWRRILVFAIVLALALGGFMGIRSRKANSAAAQAASKAQATYEAELKQYQDKLKTIEAKRKSITQSLDEATQEMESSPLVAYYVNSVFTASAVYSVTLEEPVGLQDKTNTIMRSYITLLEVDEVLRDLAQALDIDPNSIDDVLVTNYDTSTKMLTVSVSFHSAQKASEGLDLLQKQLADSHAHVSDVTAKHTLNLVVEDVKNALSEKLQQKRANQKKTCESLTKQLEDLQKSAANVAKPTAPAQITQDSAAKDAILFGIVGAVLGAFLAAAIGWVPHLAGGKVYSQRTLCNRTQVDVIAAMPSGKGNALDHWLQKLEGRTLGADSQAVCVGVIQQYCANNSKTQLLYCDIPVLEDLEKALGQQFCSAQANSLAAVEQLPACDSVLLIAQCQHTRYDTVKQQVKQLDALGKKLVGCVLIDG